MNAKLTLPLKAGTGMRFELITSEVGGHFVSTALCPFL